MIIVGNSIQLATKYRPAHRFYIYYGELASSGITDYSDYDVIVGFDENVQSVKIARDSGCRFFQYVYFGSRFADTQQFIDDLKQHVLTLKTSGLADGIFFDECDVTYWKPNYTDTDVKIFGDKLSHMCDFVRQIGMQSVVNGSVGFGKYGDYWLWESFIGTWASNFAYWQADGDGRKEAVTDGSDAAANYFFPITDLKLTGSCKFQNGSVVDGTNGTVEFIFDTSKLLAEDQRDEYDWVYTEWFGSGADDTTNTMWAYQGNTLPYDANTWTELPQLWKGEPVSWDGLGGKSKYIRILMKLNGAINFRLEQLLVAFTYIYPYYDVSGKTAFFNPYEWHWDVAQRDYIHDNYPVSTMPLLHTYGMGDDIKRQEFCYAAALAWGFPMWDYVHPMHQIVYPADIYKNAYGKFLYQIDENHAVLTGSEIVLDIENHHADVAIPKPDYYYKNRIDMSNGSGWLDSDKVYSNGSGKDYNIYDQWYGLDGTNYSTGTKTNVKRVTRSGQYQIELVANGTGTWVSPIQKSESGLHLGEMLNITWDGGNGCTLEVNYQRMDGTWSGYINYPTTGSLTVSETFKQFQIRVTLTGNVSTGSGATFVQGAYFIGAYFSWKLPLSTAAVITDVSIADDFSFLYLKYSAAAPIDFVNVDYSIFLNTDGVVDNSSGYISDWFTAGYGVNFQIANNGLNIWDNAHTPNTDYAGFQFIKILESYFSSDGKSITMKIDKKLFGANLVKNLKFFATATDKNTWFASMVSGGFHIDGTIGKVMIDNSLTYSQQSYNAVVPHGYYCSDEIPFKEAKSQIMISWEEQKPTNTDVKIWVRTYDVGWSRWKQISIGEIISGTFIKVQCCVGLYTLDGNQTPIVNNIQIS